MYRLFGLFFFIAIIGCSGSDKSTIGVSSNPNFVKGQVINGSGSICVNSRIRLFTKDDFRYVLKDSTLSDENGEFSIEASHSDKIEISNKSEIGLFSADTSLHNYQIDTASSVTSYLKKNLHFYNATKEYVVILDDTPYEVKVEKDLGYYFKFLPKGNYKQIIVELKSDGEIKSIVDTLNNKINVSSGDSLVYIPEIDSISIVADSSNFIDTYIHYDLSKDMSNQSTTDYSSESVLNIGELSDVNRYKTIIKPLFHDSVYSLDIISAYITFTVYSTFNFSDSFHYSVYKMLSDWDSHSITSVYKNSIDKWEEFPIGRNDKDADSVASFAIESDRVVSQCALPLQEWKSTQENRGVLLESNMPYENMQAYILHSSESEHAKRPVIKIYYYKN